MAIGSVRELLRKRALKKCVMEWDDMIALLDGEKPASTFGMFPFPTFDGFADELKEKAVRAKSPTDKLVEKIKKLAKELYNLEDGKKTFRTHGILAPFSFASFLDDIKENGRYKENLSEYIDAMRGGYLLGALANPYDNRVEKRKSYMFKVDDLPIIGLFSMLFSLEFFVEVGRKTIRDSARAVRPGNWFLSIPGGSARRQKKLTNKLGELNTQFRNQTLEDIRIKKGVAVLSDGSDDAEPSEEQKNIRLVEEFEQKAADFELTVNSLRERGLNDSKQIEVLLELSDLQFFKSFTTKLYIQFPQFISQFLLSTSSATRHR